MAAPDGRCGSGRGSRTRTGNLASRKPRQGSGPHQVRTTSIHLVLVSVPAHSSARVAVVRVGDRVILTEFDVAFVDGVHDPVAFVAGGSQRAEEVAVEFGGSTQSAEGDVAQPEVGFGQPCVASRSIKTVVRASVHRCSLGARPEGSWVVLTMSAAASLIGVEVWTDRSRSMEFACSPS